MPNAVFFNGQPMNDDARQALAEGYDPSSNVPVGVWRQQKAAQQAPAQAQPQQDVAGLAQLVQQAFQRPQAQAPAAPSADIGGPAQAVSDQAAAIPTAPPPALQTGQIQQALGLPPTGELANRYKYNPPWRR